VIGLNGIGDRINVLGTEQEAGDMKHDLAILSITYSVTVRQRRTRVLTIFRQTDLFRQQVWIP